MGAVMYKLYCSACETRFQITDETLNNFIDDENMIIKCPACESIEVSIIEVEGQRVGY